MIYSAVIVPVIVLIDWMLFLKFGKSEGLFIKELSWLFRLELALLGSSSFIFLFSILVQNAFSQTNPKEFAETVYEYIKDLFEGMSTNVNTSKCIKTISDKKEYFIENIEPIIANIYEPTKLIHFNG